MRIYVKSFYLFLLVCLCSCGSDRAPTYTIGIDPSWAPLEVAGKEVALLAFSYELLQEVSSNSKFKFDVVQKNWDNLLFGLQKHEYEAVFGSLFPHTFYEKMYSFSEPCILTGPVLVMAQPTLVTGSDSLAGKEIAIPADFSYAPLLEDYSGILIRSYDLVPQSLQDVLAGKLDGVLVPALIAEGYCQDLYQGKLFIVTPPLNQEGIRLITLQGKAPELISAFNKKLSKMHKDGSYETLARKWNLFSLRISK